MNATKRWQIVLAMVVLGCATAAEAVDVSPTLRTRSFDGIYGFGWIGDTEQKGLDLDSGSFLIAFRCKTDEIKRAHLSPIGIVSKKPFGTQPGYCIAMTPSYNLLVQINDHTRERSATGNLEWERRSVFAPDQWVDVAVAYDRQVQTLTIYRDGEVNKVQTDTEIGDLSNPAPFTIGVGAQHNFIRFKGAISHVGVWQFPDGLPADISASVAAMHADFNEAGCALGAAPGAAWSLWTLAESPSGVTDQGNNGNFLRYMPENDEARFQDLRRAVTVEEPRTLHVQADHPGKPEAMTGAPDHPFTSVHCAAAYATAGDTVRVHKGLYRESVSVSGGRLGAPIRIVAEPGAVISGGDLLTGWEPGDADGAYVLRDWQGDFRKAPDPNQHDSRSKPNTLVFVNDAPLEWVHHVEDLVPGTYTTVPPGKGARRDIHIFPLFGEAPDRATTEISATRRVSLADYVHMEGFTITKAGVGLNGAGCVLRGNTTRWAGVHISGADHRIEGNTVLWSGYGGLSGGGASGCLIQSNHVAYSNWRCYNPNWGGGGAKMIPCNIDAVFRGNTFTLNYGVGLWHDAYNAGNLIEYNVCHDNSGHGGIFDEINWGNTFRYNLVYNTWCTRQNRSGGYSVNIGESSEDVVHRNIVFNGERGHGIILRGYCSRTGYKSAAAVVVGCRKYPHHYVPAERQKQWVATYVKYYEGETIPQLNNRITENIVFGNALSQLWTMRDYRLPADARAAHYSFESDGNIFFAANPSNTVKTGMTDALTLEAWRAASGKDVHSQFDDPYNAPEKLPAWARDLYDFTAPRMRAAAEIAALKPDIRDGVGSMLFKARMVRSPSYTRVALADLTLRAYTLEVEGRRALVLWRSKGIGEARILTDATRVTVEDRWLRRQQRDAANGGVTVLVGRDPVYVLGVGAAAAVDATFKGRSFDTAGSLEIVSSPTPITPDGNLADWGTVLKAEALAELATARCILPQSERAWAGPTDLIARLYAVRRPEGLYLAAAVTDDSVVPREDGIDIFVDGRDAWKHFFREYEQGVCHIRVSPGDGATAEVSFPELVRKTHYARKKPAPSGVTAGWARTEDGYVLECFLPWTTANFGADTLAPDTVLRLGCLVHDTDAGREGVSSLRWNAHAISHSDTSGWAPVAVQGP